ncbi:MAG: NAD(P)H-dependent flavin oxidoreductase [Flavobacteriaceae bacterium]
MAIPEGLAGKLRIPAIAAPMFLVSGPDLVVETCRSGILGSFPALNQRESAGFDGWLSEIAERLSAHRGAAPFGVNLIVHKSNGRLEADLALCVKHKVPLVITSLGAVREVVDAVHSYGGLVFHDVISVKHARKAAEAGVDGIVAVCAGAGGHAGLLSPFALIPEIRAFFNGTIILSGAISTGAQIAAARVMGADLGYLGTRFINTRESLADPAYRQMIIEARAEDIVYTPKVSGVPANFLRASLAAAGIDPEQRGGDEGVKLHGLSDEAKAWKTIWSAGQGVGSVSDIPGAADLCERLVAEYQGAMKACAADPFLR